MSEFIAIYDPPIKEAHVYRFDSLDKACDVVRIVTEKHKVNATVSRVVKQFTIVVKEETIL